MPPFPAGGGPSAPSSGGGEPDWRSLFERERRRAEELRRGEIGWRAKARSWRRQFEIGRDKLAAARAEVREVRRGGRGCAQAEHDRLASPGGRDPANPHRGARGGACEASRESGGACQARFGRKSERRERAGSDRPRGQQAGAAGHGRTPRPGLEKRAEVHNPAADERVCSDCGKPYVANGSDTSELIEVSVKAHTRVIARPRWRRGCDCAAAPPEVSAPSVARLFANTPYGTSVWARFLYERHACLRPLNRVADWLTGQGLAISAGTPADGARRLAPLFEPLSAAIPAHQRETPVAPGRRDGLAHPGARRGRRVEPRLAVDRGLRGRGLLPCRSLAQRRGGGEAVRRRRPGHGPGVRPVQRLQETGQGLGGACDTRVLLGICCGPDYVAESSEGRSGHEFLGDVRNIIFRFAFFCHGPTSYHKEIRSCSGICSSTAARSPTIVLYTGACHLLQAGVDLNTILAWLGHASLDTTNIYAEIDLEMKAKGDGALRCRRARTRSPVEGEQGADGLPGAL